ncbi:MAG: DNA-directed RNA polymerase subunit B, partial [Candidatus Diapherotrites archaeon]|nr:DNA-directed RNA polymerase subunit B [Candidatus Diapherotrites archaeon]
MVSQNIITVYLNGTPIGTTQNGEKLAEALREKRRHGELSPHTSITYYENRAEIFINTDGGRIVRPLIIIENGKPKLLEEHVEKLKNKEMKWQDLIKEGIIEYLDAEEENNCLIAVDDDEVTSEHTHLELDPIGLVGNAASFIPFINHNLSNRNLQASKQMKQTLGLYAANYNMRPDTQAYLLNYLQRRLVPTRTTKALQLDTHPDAQNAIIALIPYYGYNTQDAIVLNKGAVDRGFARATYWKTYKTEEMIYSG